MNKIWVSFTLADLKFVTVVLPIFDKYFGPVEKRNFAEICAVSKQFLFVFKDFDL